MKQRILTGCVIAVFFLVWMLCLFTPFFGLFLAFLSGVSVYEINKAVGLKNRPIVILSIIFACLQPFVLTWENLGNNIFGTFFHNLHNASSSLLIFYILIMLTLMLFQFQKTKFEQVAISIFASMVLPYSYSCVLFLRDVYANQPNNGRLEGIFFILFSFTCSWFSDIFAYFTGRAFGKHKLCPNISPKKTVEGAVGGIVLTMLFNLLLLFVFRKFYFSAPIIPYWFIAIVSIVLSIVSIFGDLTASTLKRNFNIKDFGKLLPGHGGIMDRFDSCLFVWPCLYAILNLANLFTA